MMENADPSAVSNYTIQHLTELFDKSEIGPMVNQVEFSPSSTRNNS